MMDAYCGAGAGAGVAAAAPVRPEDLPDESLRAYLLVRAVVVSSIATRQAMLVALGRLQYAALAILCAVSARVHNPIEQNTKDWFFMRRGEHKVRVGGSEIGVILGQSRFAKPFSLWEKIIAQQLGDWETDDEMPEPCTHGHTCEDIIAEMFERMMSIKLLSGGYYRHSDEDLGQFYGASPDRLVLSRGQHIDGVPEGEVCALLEIKAPFQNMYTDVAPQYMAQIQYQMWVSGVPTCYYLAVKLRHDKIEELGTGIGPRSTPPGETRVLLTVVHYSPEYAAWMIPRLFYFTRCLVEQRKPPTDLYDSEATGYEAPPTPLVECITVQTGAWRSRPNERKRARKGTATTTPPTDTAAAATTSADGDDVIVIDGPM